MAMTAGTISVSASGVVTVTPSSYAEEEFNALKQQTEDALNEAGLSMPTDPIQLATLYTGLAAAVNQGIRMIEYIQANGEAGGDPVE